ncbi:MAG TPA: hypothetical protein VG733_04630, partial [Chthoniobacteraceae bacterium]|nr:hypothetical protein [Chthoniobacteraceae bacterium]
MFTDHPPTKPQRLLIWALIITVVIFCGVVVGRSAFLTQRRTDADDFFRAAWGIRTGRDIYELVDTQGWHYNYPPFFAIITAPFASPPPETLAQVNADSVVVKTSTYPRAYRITPNTIIDFGGHPGQLSDFKPGMIVAVTAAEDPLTADY